MLVLAIIVQWVHMLGGVFWMGGYLAGLVYMKPIVKALPGNVQAAIADDMHRRALPLFPIVIGVTGVAGILRGTIFGPIRELEALGTPYGATFLAAILFGLLAFYPFKPPWLVKAGGEHIGFFGAFTCMTLMHFGL